MLLKKVFWTKLYDMVGGEEGGEIVETEDVVAFEVSFNLSFNVDVMVVVVSGNWKKCVHCICDNQLYGKLTLMD